MSKKPNNLDVIIPIYNEQHSLPALLECLNASLSENFDQINLIFVDDGSTDQTTEVIQKLDNRSANTNIKYIKLSRNYGKDLAIKCGIDHSTAGLCAMIDGDLQHPVEKIVKAAEKIREGYNIVHIVRRESDNESLCRKLGTFFFTKLINTLSGGEIHLTEFKLIDDKAVAAMKEFKESNYFNRGVIDLIGLKSAEIFYSANKRVHGKSRYSLQKLLRLAVNSLVSVTIRPLRLAIYFGLLISTISFFYGLFLLFVKIFFGQPIEGFTTLGVSIFLLGGVQLTFLGIIGEYLGKTFIESKRRPQYTIDYVKEL